MSRQPDRLFKISVIVPVHNAEPFLAACLDAIFASEYDSYECIVVDDCSNDGSAEIARGFGARLIKLEGVAHGPAYARNRGAAAAKGLILMFVDADVVLAPGALQRVVAAFSDRSGITALFGSYDANPIAGGMVSQYRNLLHHFVHQNSSSAAATFWAGCGAVRRSAFVANGGFDEKRFHYPSIEDIELGYRLRKAGYRILLDKDLQGTHLKCWDLRSMIFTDIVHRALPWSRLILETNTIPEDLNLKRAQRVSLVSTALACAFLLFSFVYPSLFLMFIATLFVVLSINRGLYRFFYIRKGPRFMAAAIALHLLYYLYSGGSFLYALIEFYFKGKETLPFLRHSNRRRAPSSV